MSYKGGLNIMKSTLSCKTEETMAVEKIWQHMYKPSSGVDIEMAIS